VQPGRAGTPVQRTRLLGLPIHRFEGATTDVIARAIAEEIGRDVDYRPVETDGARLAAQRIAELLN
jgi:hypothetical protein